MPDPTESDDALLSGSVPEDPGLDGPVPAGRRLRLLEGVRVLDLTRFLAGLPPSATTGPAGTSRTPGDEPCHR